MSRKLTVVATDLEGVLTPEIWIAVSEKTGIRELRLTTRDEPDYDKLMKGRLRILKEHGLKLRDIQNVIAAIQPLAGALEFVNWVRSNLQLIILSDTFAEFASPLMAQLGWPTLFCNWLEVDAENNVAGYRIRKPDGKKHAVIALKGLGFHVISIGDSYNDTTMLAEADAGLLFRPPQNVIAEFPQFKVTTEYRQLQEAIERLL